MKESTNTMTSGEGERNAQRGFVQQYQSGAAAIYAALDKDQLNWVGLADRSAGIADDLVLGLPGKAVGHQFKTSTFPKAFQIEALLLGAEGMLLKLVTAWTSLRQSHGEALTEVRFVTNDIPTTNDHLLSDKDDHSAAFLREFELYHSRTLSEWKATRWQPFIDKLAAASKLPVADFETFLHAVHFLTGSAADFILRHRLSSESLKLVQQIASKLPDLVADRRNKDRWSRAELLAELGWKDRFIVHRPHQFPIGEHVQRNRKTEQQLLECIDRLDHGYLALVGPPGAGKSTLLQSALSGGPTLQLVRYLAYMPGEGQGIGRAEADNFLDDLNTQLRQSGLAGRLARNNTLQERQLELEQLLRQAGDRYRDEGIRTLIIVDGLDHIPREEHPARSLLAELPLPEALPAGVLILLGTQRLELTSLKHQVREQASLADRNIQIAPLSPEAVSEMALKLGLDKAVPRPSIYELCQGHPLVARYLIEALRQADVARREALLNGAFSFEGDIERVYKAAWREISDDADARKVIDFIARAEGPIPPELLAVATSEHAVETALRSTSHLLSQTTHGWSVFHNSFRLFVLEQPKLRFGKLDPDYAPSIYCKLAELARFAESDNPQRWLELRYLARAELHQDVLRLAQPRRFRHQLADSRPATEIQGDIRLALICAKQEPDASAVFRLLLARDEMERRCSAIEYAPAVVDALLALGDIDGVRTMAEGQIGDHYKAIDVLLVAGEIDSAKALFNEIDPFSKDSQPSPIHSDLEEWARRVFHFRDAEQIETCLAKLTATEGGHGLDVEDITTLRCNVARSAMLADPDSDPSLTARQLGVSDSELPYLLIEAGLRAYDHRELDRAHTFVDAAHTHPSFPGIASGMRRQLATLALRLGNETVSTTIFEGLETPSIALMDDAIGEHNAENITHAVIQHAALASALRLPVTNTAKSKSPVLRPLQQHANTIGMLLGRALTGHEITPGEVIQATQALLGFLDNARAASSSEFYATHQLNNIDPILSRMMIRIASMCGEQEFKAVVQLFDSSFANRKGTAKQNIPSRRAAIEEIFHSNGDMQAAFDRLEDLLGVIHGNTPEEHIDLIAGLAKLFAEMGNTERARELLQQLHTNTLGYALPAKKDPQYSLWGDLLECANHQDPAGRAQRVVLMLKQLAGMTLTEGRDAAHRLASRALSEAALCDSALGYRAAKVLTSEGLLSWDRAINALMIGVVRRNPELAASCAVTWRSLALPFYTEPYYREDQTGEFVSQVVAIAPETDLSAVVGTLLDGVEIHSTSAARVRLLQRLVAALKQRGINNERAHDALRRWQAETPIPHDRGTPGKYDDIGSLSLLDDELSRDKAPSYDSARAFSRLLDTATLEEATAIFERWPSIQRDSHARFSLIERALAEDDKTLARRLVNDSQSHDDGRPGWSYWRGAAKLKYFRALIELDGSKVHKEAYADLLEELITAPDNSSPILFDSKDVLSTICATPNWAAVWELLAEQLATTREHSLAQINLPTQAPESDEALIAALFQWSFSLSAIELTNLARAGALQLSRAPQGRPAFHLLVDALLEGNADEPAEALQLLLRDTHATATDWAERISPLVNDPDYVVAVFAGCLLDRWGNAWAMTRQELPFFYRLQMPASKGELEPSFLTDPSSGAMRVNDPLGWTAALTSQVDDLARTGISMATIRHRCYFLIESWGGLEAFGQSETTRLQSGLSKVDMKITFFRPHMLAALRALRHVAGELRLAGQVGAPAIPNLLYGMNYQADTPPLIGPTVRPAFMPRPFAHHDAGWHSGEMQWLDETELDLSPLMDNGDSVIAEISHFYCRFVRRNLEMTRARAPFFADKERRASTGYSLPGALWIEGVWAPEEPSPTIVRRVSISRIPSYPEHFLVLCPEWLQRLEWQHDPDNWMNYIDQVGECVAKLIWWRDGASLDVDQDQFWGEGVALVVTSKGRKALEDVAGPLDIWVHACRSVDGDKPAESYLSRVER
ncbi:ATP-binding protein [Pseudomonas proteolytica]|uniref:AAA family ATPase n=1 Tax=Pseudomonas proteolytica TaxID=219574 RepID=UPI001474A84D|nr:ATP-binding protein [Pseudomonas proteolytica]NMZ15029.1 ATP-binding protein [Pseudomonas proteolytica]